jgi:hypothetical protein
MARMQEDAEEYFQTWKPEHAIVDQEEKTENIEVHNSTPGTQTIQANLLSLDPQIVV